MTSRMIYTLKDESTRKDVLRTIMAMPLGGRVEVKPQKRSLPQNDLFWGLLTDVARQKTHAGQAMSPDVWKAIFLNAIGKEITFLPTLDGRSVFPMGRSSADLSRGEMLDLTDFIIAWGTQNGVVFSHLPPLAEPVR